MTSCRVDGVGAAEPETLSTRLFWYSPTPLHYAASARRRFKRQIYTGRSGCGVVRYQGRCSVTPLGNASFAATLVSRGAT